MTKEHITKQEIFDRIISIRNDNENDFINFNIREALIDLETSILQDLRSNNPF